jgi:hypothetical protein
MLTTRTFLLKSALLAFAFASLTSVIAHAQSQSADDRLQSCNAATNQWADNASKAVQDRYYANSRRTAGRATNNPTDTPMDRELQQIENTRNNKLAACQRTYDDAVRNRR